MAESETFSDYGKLSNPATGAQAVTPGSALPSSPTRGLYVGTAGNVNVTMVNGDVITFVGVVAGAILPVMVQAVGGSGAGTTASNIVALY